MKFIRDTRFFLPLECSDAYLLAIVKSVMSEFNYLCCALCSSALMPCDSSHLTKDLSIPLVNQWSTITNNQGDVKLFRRYVLFLWAYYIFINLNIWSLWVNTRHSISKQLLIDAINVQNFDDVFVHPGGVSTVWSNFLPRSVWTLIPKGLMGDRTEMLPGLQQVKMHLTATIFITSSSLQHLKRAKICVVLLLFVALKPFNTIFQSNREHVR